MSWFGRGRKGPRGKGEKEGLEMTLARFLETMGEEKRRYARLASLALLRRVNEGKAEAERLTERDAYDVCCIKLYAARGGDEVAQRSAQDLVREGYDLDREAHIRDFIAGLTRPQKLEISALAWFATGRQGRDERAAFAHAVQTAYDRQHHYDPAGREKADRLLLTLIELIEVNPDMKGSVERFQAQRTELLLSRLH